MNRRQYVVNALLVACLLSACGAQKLAAPVDRADPDPEALSTYDPAGVPVGKGLQKAMLAGGCFWHVEAALQNIRGVKSTTVGYTGGGEENPTYPVVCQGRTGHAEAVEVVFDPSEITYEELLSKFFDAHDAAAEEAGRKLHGGQYRSEIFYFNDDQKEIAQSVKRTRERKAGKKLHTEIEPVMKFTVAEDFHQNYLKARGLSHCN